MSESYTELLHVISQAAQAAAAIIQRGSERRTSIRWESKGPADFVSDVDRNAEEAIANTLAQAFPEATMLGEESWGGDTVGNGLCFVVDPLDGTTNFLHGIMEYAVSIAAVDDGVPVAGIVLNAARGDMYTGIRGGGAFRDGERMAVSPITNPARSLIATGFPFKAMGELQRYTEQFKAVARETSGIRRAGAAALDLANVASGRFEAFWELDLGPWDKAAGILLVREAGGIVTDLLGEQAQIQSGPLVAGSPTMHRWLLDTLRSADGGIAHEAD